MTPLQIVGMVAYGLIYWAFAGVAINLGYHRVLSHRSLKLAKPIERFAVILGLPAGTPIQWAGNHRHHHANTDVAGDPHSPHLDGFWYAHVGWYIGTHNVPLCVLYSLAGPLRTLYDGWHRPRSGLQYNDLAKDVAADPFYVWISRPGPYLLACVLHVAYFFGLAMFFWGWAGLALAWFVSAWIYNLGDMIDSVAHIVGVQPYASPHLARNHWFMGYFTLGEGWHANHHEFPNSARHGLLAGQHDWTWGMIRLLEMAGWATEIKVPTPELIQAKLARGPGALNADSGIVAGR